MGGMERGREELVVVVVVGGVKVVSGAAEGAGWRSSFIKSLQEVAPVVFQPVHQRRRRRRRRMHSDPQRRTVARSSFLHFNPPPTTTLIADPPFLPHGRPCPASPLTAHLLTAITPSSSSPPSHRLSLYLPPLLHLSLSLFP